MKILPSIALATIVASLVPHSANATNPVVAAASQKQDPVAAANALLDDMDAGHFDAVYARFAPEMAKAVDAAKLKMVWAAMPAQFGSFKHRGAARVQSANGATAVVIPLAYERADLQATIVTSADGKVSGFLIAPAAPAAPPPAPARGDLSSREVRFAPSGRSELPGTLLLPKGEGPFPVAVLVHGSGPQDRDETAGGTRVFRDVAEGLADRGIASLRYDKRTLAHPGEFQGAFTIDDETTDDAVAAAAFLRTQPGIDPRRIYVVGHSQGAMMAPRIARKSAGSVKGLVLMAAPARHLEDILVEQNEYMARLDGHVDAAEQAQLAELKEAVAAVKRIDARTPARQQFLLNLPASYWLDLRDYDEVAAARAIGQPMLVLQGDRDFQVTAPDWKRWNDAFARDPRVTIRHYPALNHLFVAGKGTPSLAEYNAPGHVDAQAIADMANWIKAH